MKEPKIIQVLQKRFVGKRIQTTLATYHPQALWQPFMQKKTGIPHLIDGMYYSIQVYDPHMSFTDFTPQTSFDMWAAIEVSEKGSIPEGMEILSLSSGQYAVFIHQGTHQSFPKTQAHIFGRWLPQSGFQVDNRPHMQVMGEKYLGPTDPNSEEEVWVPIK